MAEKKPEVVIIGGGFGGLYAALSLKRAPVNVTLIDRRNFHLFQPLLYQVAMDFARQHRVQRAHLAATGECTRAPGRGYEHRRSPETN